MRPVEDSTEIGKKIEPMSVTIATLPQVDKSKFKHWQPWLKDENLPEWADTMRNRSDLKTLLTKDSAEGEEALMQQAMWWQRQLYKRK